MTDKDLVNEFLNQIYDILGKAQDKTTHQFKEELPEDIELQIASLEKDIEAFVSINEQIMKAGGFTEDKLEETLKNPTHHVNPYSQNILEKARNLKMEVESAVRSLSASAESVKKRQAIEGKGGDQTSRNVARMKKFKRVGGKKGWTPL